MRLKTNCRKEARSDSSRLASANWDSVGNVDCCRCLEVYIQNQMRILSPEDFPQRKPGEAVRLNWKKQVLRFACCDCALVHNIKFTVEGEILTLRAYRNKRLTVHFRKTTGKDAWGNL